MVQGTALRLALRRPPQDRRSQAYTDGALGSRGAWLKQAYADKPDSRGLQFLSGCTAPCDQAGKAGPADSRSRSTRSAMPRMRRSFPPTSSCRSQIPGRSPLADRAFPDSRPSRYPAPRPAGIIASMQPVHQTSDRLMAESGSDRTGSRAPMPGRASSGRARGSPSGPTSRWNRPIPSPASPRRSAGRT